MMVYMLECNIIENEGGKTVGAFSTRELAESYARINDLQAWEVDEHAVDALVSSFGTTCRHDLRHLGKIGARVWCADCGSERIVIVPDWADA